MARGRQPGNIPCPPKPKPPAVVPLPVRDYTWVFVDIESTGTSAFPDIIQLSATVRGTMFNKYVIPPSPINPYVTRMTKLEVIDGSLYKDNVYIEEAVSIHHCLTDFIPWLSQFHKPVLIGHGALTADSVHLAHALLHPSCSKLSAEFRRVVCGFVDSLPLCREARPDIKSHKLANLVRDVVGSTFEQHDSLEDAKALQAVVEHLSIDADTICKHSFHVDYPYQYIDYKKLVGPPKKKKKKNWNEENMKKPKVL